MATILLGTALPWISRVGEHKAFGSNVNNLAGRTKSRKVNAQMTLPQPRARGHPRTFPPTHNPPKLPTNPAGLAGASQGNGLASETSQNPVPCQSLSPPAALPNTGVKADVYLEYLTPLVMSGNSIRDYSITFKSPLGCTLTHGPPHTCTNVPFKPIAGAVKELSGDLAGSKTNSHLAAGCGLGVRAVIYPYQGLRTIGSYIPN